MSSFAGSLFRGAKGESSRSAGESSTTTVIRKLDALFAQTSQAATMSSSRTPASRALEFLGSEAWDSLHFITARTLPTIYSQTHRPVHPEKQTPKERQ